MSWDAADIALLRSELDAFAAEVSVTEPVDEVVNGQLALPGRAVALRTYAMYDGVDATLVWFHGGGYVSGSLAAIDPVCRALVRRTGWTVVSVDYRLAPEHPFPAAFDDCLAVVEHVAGSARHLAVGGDSAGGGLAAAVARAWPGELAALLLLCPWLDLRLTSSSVGANGSAFGLTEESLRAFARLYGGDPYDRRVSPALGDVSGLPPVVVVTAEHDPLRDEAERYAQEVVAAGGTAAARRWDGMVHGFVGMTASLPEAYEALQWTADQLVRVSGLGVRGAH